MARGAVANPAYSATLTASSATRIVSLQRHEAGSAVVPLSDLHASYGDAAFVLAVFVGFAACLYAIGKFL
jgi:hypothetical protein